MLIATETTKLTCELTWIIIVIVQFMCVCCTYVATFGTGKKCKLLYMWSNISDVCNVHYVSVTYPTGPVPCKCCECGLALIFYYFNICCILVTSGGVGVSSELPWILYS